MSSKSPTHRHNFTPSKDLSAWRYQNVELATDGNWNFRLTREQFLLLQANYINFPSSFTSVIQLMATWYLGEKADNLEQEYVASSSKNHHFQVWFLFAGLFVSHWRSFCSEKMSLLVCQGPVLYFVIKGILRETEKFLCIYIEKW